MPFAVRKNGCVLYSTMSTCVQKQIQLAGTGNQVLFRFARQQVNDRHFFLTPCGTWQTDLAKRLFRFFTWGDFRLAIVRLGCFSQRLGFCLRLQTKEEKNWDAKQRVYNPQALLLEGHLKLDRQPERTSDFTVAIREPLKVAPQRFDSQKL